MEAIAFRKTEAKPQSYGMQKKNSFGFPISQSCLKYNDDLDFVNFQYCVNKTCSRSNRITRRRLPTHPCLDLVDFNASIFLSKNFN